MGARLYAKLIECATDKDRGTDIMVVIQSIAGVLVETALVFEKPDEAMESLLYRFSNMLCCRPYEGPLSLDTLPPAHVIDRETEKGRLMARQFFEEWLDCEYTFCDLMMVIVHNLCVQWEMHGMQRSESLRLLAECTKRCMAFEIAAQELCDVVIENKVARDQWTLSHCIASLGAIAGRRLALSTDADSGY